jgi:hypothetical protein
MQYIVLNFFEIFFVIVIKLFVFSVFVLSKIFFIFLLKVVLSMKLSCLNKKNPGFSIFQPGLFWAFCSLFRQFYNAFAFRNDFSQVEHLFFGKFPCKSVSGNGTLVKSNHFRAFGGSFFCQFFNDR